MFEQPVLHFLYVAPVLFIFCTILLVVFSLLSPAPSEEQVAPLIWTRKFFDAETAELAALPWYMNYRLHAAILAGITLIILVAFW